MSEGQNPPGGTILETVADYYAARLRRFGTTPQGVDWSAADSQLLRFDRLLQVAQDGGDASLIDYGCGYGALVDYLAATGRPFSYSRVRRLRVDDSGRHSQARRRRPLFLHASADGADAGRLHRGERHLQREARARRRRVARLRHAHVDDDGGVEQPRLRVQHALDVFRPAKRRRDLFYGDPARMFDLCMQRFSPRVALLHDYPLYEFTIIVRM